MKKNKKMSGGKKVVMGAGVAAAGAGAYYLFGPKAKAHQKKAKVLMGKMEKEVASKIKKAKIAGTPLYHKAVEVIAANYAKEYKLHEKDIKAFANKLKNDWNSTKKATKKNVKKSLRATKKKRS